MEEKCEGSAASVQRSVEDTAPCSLEKDDAVQCVDQYDILGYSEEQFQQEEELWARWSQSLNERRQIDRRVPKCKADSTLHQKADWTSSGQAGFTQVLLKRPGRSRGMHVLHRSCHRNWANESGAATKAFIESGPRFFAPSFMEPDQQSNESRRANTWPLCKLANTIDIPRAVKDAIAASKNLHAARKAKHKGQACCDRQHAARSLRTASTIPRMAGAEPKITQKVDAPVVPPLLGSAGGRPRSSKQRRRQKMARALAERTMGKHVAMSTSPKKGIALPACKILLGRGPRIKSASLPRPKAKDPNLLKWYASGERVRDATPDDAEQVCEKRALLYRRISSGDCRVIFGHHRIQCLGAPERERMQIR